ncbi:hypothetical protein [Variovorax sp. LT1R16]|uniref:hypothetical protein n=1 Tax=Variovorax sp. LT1R16 TaxID=3443728 RepID=UPI003F47427D
MDAPAVIAVVTYENPPIVEAVLEIGAKAVLPSPGRSFGLVVAREAHKESRLLARRLRKVEAKLLDVRQLLKAKSIPVKTRSVSKGQAHDDGRNRGGHRERQRDSFAGRAQTPSVLTGVGCHSPLRERCHGSRAVIPILHAENDRLERCRFTARSAFGRGRLGSRRPTPPRSLLLRWRYSAAVGLESERWLLTHLQRLRRRAC